MSAQIEAGTYNTDAKLRTTILAQAKLRVFLAIPIVVGEMLLFFAIPDGIPRWYFDFSVFYCVYILLAYVLAHARSPLSPRHLLLATTVLDPVALSAWLIFTGEYGSIIVGFYLFTILGFGFRTGRRLMHLCQAASILGFTSVLLLSSFWQQHLVIWLSALIPLIVVPMYAGKLIKKLREARDHAERESQAKSELLAKVSHELRTPLTGIIAATELLAFESGSSVVAKRTETILMLSNELLCEINDLLDEAKYEAGSFELSDAPVDLREQIALVRATLETMAAKKGLEFHAEINPTIKDWVESDAHHLGRVLVNLAGNAVKFTDRGQVRLDIDLLEENSESYRLRFSVTDTGIGMPDDFRAKIFNPFSQVNQGANRRYGGTGLGLALSKQIVKLLGSDLLFESEPDKGSRFWFDLTLRRLAPPATEVKAASAEIAFGKRILVAEDNLTNLLLLKELLEIDRHTVTTCTSGMTALELLAAQNFDVLLLDYNLGDMDGVRVLQTYRFGRLNCAPALFLTADATILTATRLKEAGGTGILYKPISLIELRKAIAQISSPAIAEEEPRPEQQAPALESVKPARPTLTAVPMTPIDMGLIEELKEVSARPEFFPSLIAEAEKDISRNCQLLIDALAEKSYASIHDSAHALKGVSANIGALRLVALATSLMVASSEELHDSRERIQADLNDARHMTLQALRAILSETKAASSGNAAALHLN